MAVIEMNFNCKCVNCKGPHGVVVTSEMLYARYWDNLNTMALDEYSEVFDAWISPGSEPWL